jgi:hypothetical protein
MDNAFSIREDAFSHRGCFEAVVEHVLPEWTQQRQRTVGGRESITEIIRIQASQQRVGTVVETVMSA